MNSPRLIGTIVGMILVAAASTWIGTAMAVPSAYDIRETTTTVYPAGDEVAPPSERSGFVVDRYGNLIEKAIGDYRVDPRGDIFERHSPTTAVPRLPDPSV
jgi:hypothetical protein